MIVARLLCLWLFFATALLFIHHPSILFFSSEFGPRGRIDTHQCSSEPSPIPYKTICMRQWNPYALFFNVRSGSNQRNPTRVNITLASVLCSIAHRL